MATSATASIAAAIVGGSSVMAQPGQPLISKWLLNLEFTFDPRTLDQGRTGAALATPVPGPVYLAGTLYEAGSLNADGTVKSDAIVRGNHRFAGWLYDPAAMNVAGVHTFDIFGRGKVVVTGATDALNAPVSGGTGEFKFAQGEARVGVINRTNLAYALVLELQAGSVGQ
jgi:hypothetical protein